MAKHVELVVHGLEEKMRAFSGLFTAVFLLAAWVQLNDPDPLLWIVGYLVAAIISGAAAFGRVSVVPATIAAIAFSIWFLSLAPTLFSAEPEAFTSFQMKAATHEEPREAIGLALCAAWCAALAVWAARRDPSERDR